MTKLEEAPPAPSAMLEKHFSVHELAALWGFSRGVVRRWFMDEPGVLREGSSFRRGKRGYVTLRIPRSVAERVYALRTRVK
jgi:hypothetical protein